MAYEATVKLKSASPLSFSRMHQTEKLEKESPDDYEKRTWMERLHYDKDGEVFIPPMALKNCMNNAAKFLNIKIPGGAGGKATYTKHVKAGVLAMYPIMLGISKDDIEHEWLPCSADGTPGGAKRVMKCFPIIHEWEAETIINVFDETVTRDVFKRVIEEAGKFIGLLRFRPMNGGYYGRFTVEGLEFS